MPLPTSLVVTRTQLLDQIGDELNWGSAYTDWSSNTADVNRVNRAIQAGLRAFYIPPILTWLPNERTPWKWSFLSPTITLSLSAGMKTLTLPEEFGGFKPGVSELSYYRHNNQPNSLTLVGLHVIHKARQENGDDSVTAAPLMAAHRVHGSSGEAVQQQSLEFWPTCDGDYQLELPIIVNPYDLSSDYPYPLGGQPHAEAIRLACLWKALLQYHELAQAGNREREFQTALASAVMHDREVVAAARRVGRNYDESLEGHIPRRLRNMGVVTYNGAEYNGANS